MKIFSNKIAKLASWNVQRNAAQTKINWQFTTADTRTKLKHLYPVIDD